MTTSDNQSSQVPKHLYQLVWTMLKSIVKSIPKMALRQLIKLVLIFLTIVVINTYLVVVKNEGFAPSKGNALMPITALKNSYQSASIFWMFALFFIMTIVGRIRQDSLKTFLKEIVMIPSSIIHDFSKVTSAHKGIFFITTGIYLLVFMLIPNTYLVILYFFILLLSYSLREKGFIGIAIKMGLDDVNQLRKKKIQINKSFIFIMVLSVTFALLICWVMPFGDWSFYVLAAVFVVLGFLVGMEMLSSRQAASMLVMTILGSIIAKIFDVSVLADDGGWIESGATFSNWIQSEGAGTAVLMGGPPAIGATLGTYLGSLLAESGFGEWLGEVGEEVYDELVEVGEELYEGLEEVGEVIYEELEDASEVIYNTMEETGEALVNGIEEVGEVIYEEAENLGEETYEQLGVWGEDILTDIGAEISYFAEHGSWAPSGDDSTIKWGLDTISNILGLNDVGEFIKNTVPTEYGYFGHAMNFISTADNAINNMVNLGDGPSYAIIKAASNTFAMAELGNLNPQLAGMELATHLLYGGSNAGEIISPIKTLSGLANLIMDSVFNNENIVERINSDGTSGPNTGAYGANIQSLYNGYVEAETAYTNPLAYLESLAPSLDVHNPEGSLFDALHDSTYDLFALPPNANVGLDIDHPFDSIRTLASAFSTASINGLIYTGEGVGHAASWLGDYVGSNQTLDNALTQTTNAISSYSEAIANQVAESSADLGDYVGSNQTLDSALTSIENLGGSIQEAWENVDISESLNNTPIGQMVNVADNLMDSIDNWFKGGE